MSVTQTQTLAFICPSSCLVSPFQYCCVPPTHLRYVPLWLLLAIFSYPSIFPSHSSLLQLKLKSMARTSLLLRSSQDKHMVRSRRKPAFLCFHDGASPFLPPSSSPPLKYMHGISPSSPHPHPQLSGEGLDPFFTFCEDLGTSPQSPPSTPVATSVQATLGLHGTMSLIKCLPPQIKLQLSLCL